MKEQEWLEEGWFFHNHAWHLLHEIIKQIPEDTKSVLDVGAGTGIALAVIKAIYPDIEAYAIEQEIKSLQFWKKRGIQGEIINDVFIPLKGNKFDFVFSSHVLEHVHGDKAVTFVSEIIRVCKKRAVIIVPDGDVHFYDHKVIYNRSEFKSVALKAIGENNYKAFFMPLYHHHINNLIAVIDK